MRDARVTRIVVAAIKRTRPQLFQHVRANAHRDDVGNPIHVREDGIAWETCEWVDYALLDEINDAVEAAGVAAVVEYSNSYEVMVEAL